jgi:hypothetical protein
LARDTLTLHVGVNISFFHLCSESTMLTSNHVTVAGRLCCGGLEAQAIGTAAGETGYCIRYKAIEFARSSSFATEDHIEIERCSLPDTYAWVKRIGSKRALFELDACNGLLLCRIWIPLHMFLVTKQCLEQQDFMRSYQARICLCPLQTLRHRDKWIKMAPYSIII